MLQHETKAWLQGHMWQEPDFHRRRVKVYINHRVATTTSGEEALRPCSSVLRGSRHRPPCSNAETVTNVDRPRAGQRVRTLG